jgi:transposase-like protein
VNFIGSQSPAIGLKRSAVALVLEQNYTPSQAAANLGIGKNTLYNWLRAHEQRTGHATPDDERDLKQRVAALERDLRRVTMERDILKKATAYFAKESL